ncbi:MAG: DUF2764 domain-containing protein [Kiritimatiellae bacterium]|nr:DUF2764 domain-containing protein [Kiritimatiellia bacterium]
MKYAYFAASLPALVFNSPPPMSVEQFRAAAARLLTPADRATLDALLEGAPSEHPFVAEWRARDTQLRNAVARARAAAAGIEARPFLHEHTGWDVALERSVMDAMGRPTPLERELELDRCRWHLAEDLARFRPFDLEGVLAYALKLRILERWSRMDADAGRRRLSEWVERAVRGTAGER